jgi:hypothetical protein
MGVESHYHSKKDRVFVRGDRFFLRDFFAFSKEVWCGIWLRRAAAL